LVDNEIVSVTNIVSCPGVVYTANEGVVVVIRIVGVTVR